MQGIELEVLWFADDVAGLRVFANSVRFAATAEVYADPGVFQRVATVLEGFPNSKSDSREFEIGTFDRGSAGGGARFRFRTSDSLGHAVVEVGVSSSSGGGPQRYETADFAIPVEAAGVDDFVTALRTTDLAVGVTCSLSASR